MLPPPRLLLPLLHLSYSFPILHATAPSRLFLPPNPPSSQPPYDVGREHPPPPHLTSAALSEMQLMSESMSLDISARKALLHAPRSLLHSLLDPCLHNLRIMSTSNDPPPLPTPAPQTPRRPKRARLTMPSTTPKSSSGTSTHRRKRNKLTGIASSTEKSNSRSMLRFFVKPPATRCAASLVVVHLAPSGFLKL